MGRKTRVTRPLRADSRERPALTLTLDSTDKRRARTGSANADALSLPDLKDGVSREISDEENRKKLRRVRLHYRFLCGQRWLHVRGRESQSFNGVVLAMVAEILDSVTEWIVNVFDSSQLTVIGFLILMVLGIFFRGVFRLIFWISLAVFVLAYASGNAEAIEAFLGRWMPKF
jgi:hypothetical protein